MPDEENEELAKETSDEGSEEATVEPAPETAAASPQKPANELKVVIVMKDGRILMGVQSPDCDPVYKTMDGSLATVLEKLPALVAEAKERWAANPRYPKADLPKPAPSPTPARTPAASSAPKKPPQPSFF
ncbi:hypothetical protein LCGC14_0765060 [marine sediment metagenome]|uniref:Uncharacterized protein n=1 Tax=marine sediment metagenome TaxID=412755 RepID=A0A0F9T726_9ZZZZ